MANGQEYERHGNKRPASMPPVGPYANPAIAISADVFLQPLHINTGMYFYMGFSLLSSLKFIKMYQDGAT